MNTEKEKPETPQSEEQDESLCSCFQDPFAALPPELRPRQRSWKDGLRKVTCPECGFQYWTNRETDLCLDCEKKFAPKPAPKSSKGTNASESSPVTK